jgi:Yip1-like protein
VPLLLSILIRPRAAAVELKDRPRWLVSFLLLGLLFVFAEMLIEERAMRSVLDRLPLSATPADREDVASMLQGGELTRLAFFPVRLLAGWITFALALFYACRLLSPPGIYRFKQILALEVHAEIATLVEKLATATLAPSAGESARGLAQVPLSLASLHSADSFSWSALFNGVNLFQIFYVILLGVGISTITGLRWWKAGMVVVAVWGVSAAGNVALITVLRESMRFRL